MPTALRETPPEAVALIKSFEGLPDGDPATVNLDAYLDPLGIWTIGWGHVVLWQGRPLKGADNKALARRLYPGGISVAQAEALLRADLLDRSPSLLHLVQVPLDDGQFGALMSFAFNCGLANLGGSTLLRLLNAGRFAAAAEQFLLWNKGRKNGVLVELPGLTRRRRAERAMFLGQDWRAASLAGVARGGVPATTSAAGASAATRGRSASGYAPAPGNPSPTRPRKPAPERPVPPSAAVQRKAARAAEGVSMPLTPRARTTTATARPPAARTTRPGRRTAP
ncbi:MAG: lysozyme [Rubrivivax sp.]